MVLRTFAATFRSSACDSASIALRRYGLHLVKSIRRHNIVRDHRIWTKFGRPMQNHIPLTAKRSGFKQEVEFQYGDRLLSGSGSSNI